jgi:hypothetical protein
MPSHTREEECELQHCEDNGCGNGAAKDIAADYLRQIRMGYKVEVTLQEVLEEIERSLS